nr:hypothetical protein [Tanacetum cinerariifolium]
MVNETEKSAKEDKEKRAGPSPGDAPRAESIESSGKGPKDGNVVSLKKIDAAAISLDRVAAAAAGVKFM